MKIPKLILPKNRVFLPAVDGIRLYFLAGPIRGAADWQAKAIQLLTEKDPNCYIACPCRYDEKHSLFQYSVPDNTTDVLSEASNSLKYMDLGDDDNMNIPDFEPFPNQTMWERYYLAKASQVGSVIFWLPCEDKKNPRKDGPYAQDTYGELGRWSMRSACRITPTSDRFTSVKEHVNLVVGAERDFPGLSVIQKNFDADHGRPFPIHTTLEETIAAAVRLGKETNSQSLFSRDKA